MLKTKNRPSRSLSHGDVGGDSSSKTTPSATSGLFGRELADVILDSGIPAIVEDCIEWIETHALDEEGLFRIPADPKELKKLRDMYDAAPKAHFDLKKENPSAHSVAALLKMYLREIPEPLLLYRFYETFIKVAKNEDAPTRLRNLRMLIQGLPPVYRTVLLYLLKFLNKFSSHSSNNKMTLANLATCWAPNLLRSKEESYEKVLREASLVNQVVTTLIEHINFIEVEKKNAVDKASYSAEQIPEYHPPPPTKPSFASDGVIPAILNLQTRVERSHSSNSGSLSPMKEAPRKESPSEWKEAVTKDGRKYYYNTITRQSSWTPPETEPREFARSNSDDSALAASKNSVSEKIEGIAPEQTTTTTAPKEEAPKVIETPKVVETPKVAETPKTEAPKTATPTGYINPAKTNTVSVQQLRAMLDECGVDHSDCITRADLVKKVMESFTVNLPPPLPPAPRKN